MRRHNIVSGILFILSIIDFALAAPILAEEKRQAAVDVAHMIPKDVITALGKRVDEEAVAKLAEELLETGGKQESAVTHAPSSSAPSGPGHGSTNVPQAADPDLTLNIGANLNYRPNLALSAVPTHPGASVKQDFTWNHGVDVDFRPNLAASEMSGQQAGHWQDPMLPDNTLPLIYGSTDESGSKYWTSMSLGDLLPKPEPLKGVGKAHESHGQQPNAGPGPSDPGPSNAKPSNSWPTTTLDSSAGSGVNRPLPPPTDSERATMGYRPPPPPTELSLSPTGPAPTEARPYQPYAWLAEHPPSPGAWSPTEHWEETPPPPKRSEGRMVYEQPSTLGSPTDPKL